MSQVLPAGTELVRWSQTVEEHRAGARALMGLLRRSVVGAALVSAILEGATWGAAEVLLPSLDLPWGAGVLGVLVPPAMFLMMLIAESWIGTPPVYRLTVDGLRWGQKQVRWKDLAGYRVDADEDGRWSLLLVKRNRYKRRIALPMAAAERQAVIAELEREATALPPEQQRARFDLPWPYSLAIYGSIGAWAPLASWAVLRYAGGLEGAARLVSAIPGRGVGLIAVTTLAGPGLLVAPLLREPLRADWRDLLMIAMVINWVASMLAGQWLILLGLV